MQAPKDKQAAVNSSLKFREQRQNVRIPLSLPISITGNGHRDIQGRIVNMSLRGLLVESPVLLKARSNVHLRFIWPPTRFCTAQGQVIRAAMNRFAIALSDQNESYDQLLQVLSLSDEEEVKCLMKAMLSCVLEAK